MTQKGDGLMSTIKDEDFDYQTYMRENPPDPLKIQRGLKARKERMEAALKKLSFRIDKDIIDQFQQLVSPGQDCGKLINQALREWLSAKGVTDLVRTELHQVLQDVLYSYQDEMGTMKIADQKSSYNK